MIDELVYNLTQLLDNLKACPETESKVPLNASKIRRHIKIFGSDVWICANTEQEYADKLIRFAMGSSNRSTEVRKHNFGDYARRWFAVYSKPNVSHVTAVSYEHQLERYILPSLGSFDLEDISVSDVQAMFNVMPKDSKQQTKNKLKQVLNQIFRTAIDEGYIAKNPLDAVSLKIRGLASEETKPYTVEQMRYLASHLNDISDPTEKAWLALSITLPLRPEEVLGLRWSDVNVDEGTIDICSTVTHPTRNEPEFKPYPKTASSRRTLNVPREVLDILPERGHDDWFVIGGSEPVSYTKLRGMRKRINLATGFGETITPRRFRTTVATDISAETHDLKLVQRMLGHSTPEMTLKHYDKGRSTSVDAVDAVTKAYGMRQ